MARGGAVTGKASAPLPEYPTETWTCDTCGKPIRIWLTPTALDRRAYPHSVCGGFYCPEPGTEAPGGD